MVRWSIYRIGYISVRLSSTFIYHHLPMNSRCTFHYWLFLLTASFNTSKSWLLCSWPGSNSRLLRQLCRFGGLVPATPQWLGGGSGHFLGDDRHGTPPDSRHMILDQHYVCFIVLASLMEASRWWWNQNIIASGAACAATTTIIISGISSIIFHNNGFHHSAWSMILTLIMTTVDCTLCSWSCLHQVFTSSRPSCSWQVHQTRPRVALPQQRDLHCSRTCILGVGERGYGDRMALAGHLVLRIQPLSVKLASIILEQPLIGSMIR